MASACSTECGEAIATAATDASITTPTPLANRRHRAVMVLAFLFGLSMDYEVFILSRIREEYHAAKSTDAAVIEGVGRTGRLVTSAALILFLAFAALASGPGTDLKTLATGLGFGMLLDATIVRAALVPLLVSLFGSWNWYLPTAVGKLLRVKPSYPPRQGSLRATHTRIAERMAAKRPLAMPVTTLANERPTRHALS